MISSCVFTHPSPGTGGTPTGAQLMTAPLKVLCDYYTKYPIQPVTKSGCATGGGLHSVDGLWWCAANLLALTTAVLHSACCVKMENGWRWMGSMTPMSAPDGVPGYASGAICTIATPLPCALRVLSRYSKCHKCLPMSLPNCRCMANVP